LQRVRAVGVAGPAWSRCSSNRLCGPVNAQAIPAMGQPRRGPERVPTNLPMKTPAWKACGV